MIAKVTALTPPGTAALASVGVWGPDALSLVLKFFQPIGAIPPSHSARPRPWLGRIDTPAVADEVVVVLSGSPSAQRVEVFCHGSPAIVAGLRRLLEDAGATAGSPQEWHRAVQPDLLAAEAAEALTRCETLRTADHLLAQQHGALRREVQRLIALAQAGNVAELQVGLEALVATSEFGRHLTEPWQVVIAGMVNAGKSSLINALAGFERAITSPEPGTTRDLVSTVIAVDGWPITLIDTAGYRHQATGVEAAGIALMVQQLANADLVIWLMEPGDSFVLTQVEQKAKRLLFRRNKVDLLPAEQAQIKDLSARTGAGLAELRRDILGQLIPNPPQHDAPLLFTSRQRADATGALLAANTNELDCCIAWLERLLGPT